MPTAARLVAAISLALVALAVSLQVPPRMPEHTEFGYFFHVNIGLGLVCGWIVLGRRTGLGVIGALNNGVAAVAVLVFWGLAVQGGYEMIRLAMNRRYDGPIEAIYAIFELAVGYAHVLLAPGIIATLLVGAVLSGLATETAGKMWR